MKKEKRKTNKNDQQLLTDNHPLINNDEDHTEGTGNISAARWHFVNALSHTSVALNPGFEIFLYLSIRQAIYGISEELLSEYDADSYRSIVHTIDFALFMFFSAVAFGSLIGAYTMVSPADQSYELLSTSGSIDEMMVSLYGQGESDEERRQHVYKHFNRAQIYSPKILYYTQLPLVFMFNYIVISSSSAISIATLANNSPWVLFPSLALFGLITGPGYYTLLTDKALKRHSIEFATKLFSTKESLALSVLRSPGRGLEVIIKAVFNATYRGVIASYIASSLLTLAPKSLGYAAYTGLGSTALIIIPGVVTFMSTLTSRTLGTVDYYFPEHQNLPSNIQVKSSHGERFKEIFFGTVRSAPIGGVVYTFLNKNIASLPLKLAISITTSSLVFSHYLYTNINVIKTHKIIATLKPKTTNENQSLLSSQLFLNFMNNYKHVGKIENISVCINVCARSIRVVAFLTFFDSLLIKSFSLNLTHTQGLLMALPIAIEIAKSDYFFLQKGFEKTFMQHITRFLVLCYAKKHDISPLKSTARTRYTLFAPIVDLKKEILSKLTEPNKDEEKQQDDTQYGSTFIHDT